MSVLNRKELADSPLADLHQIASELGMEGYRAMRKDDLIGAILGVSGGADEPAGGVSAAVADEGAEESVAVADEEGEESVAVADEEGEESVAVADEDAEESVAVADEGGQESVAVADEDAEEDTSEGTSEGTSEDTSEGTSEGTSEDTSEGTSGEGEEVVEEEPEVVEDEISDDEISTGVLDVLANGSGFVRMDPSGQSRGDVYVSPAQIRRCELRAGDDVSGPARRPRRNERHPSLVRVETVNGAPAEPAEQRPWFGELTAVFPTRKLPAPKTFKDAPYGRGSRVAIAGPPGAGATTLLREIAQELSGDEELGVQVVLAGALPEDVTEWHRTDGLAVAGGSFDRSPDAQAQAAELAVERAKRRVERGGHAVVLIDSLEGLPAGARRRVFGAGRATEEGGTLTVIASVGGDSEPLRWATTRVVLGTDGKLAPESGTVRADALS